MNHEGNRFIYDHFNGWLLVSGPWFDQLQRVKESPVRLWDFSHGVDSIEWERLPFPSGRVAWRRLPLSIIPETINGIQEHKV